MKVSGKSHWLTTTDKRLPDKSYGKGYGVKATG